jgi:hypothetical protein
MVWAEGESGWRLCFIRMLPPRLLRHSGEFAEMGEANPQETGEMVGIQKVLADKMALSQQQIQKACKIGECAPSK